MVNEQRFGSEDPQIEGDGQTTSFAFDHSFKSITRITVHTIDGEKAAAKTPTASPNQVTVAFDEPPPVGTVLTVKISGIRAMSL